MRIQCPGQGSTARRVLTLILISLLVAGPNAMAFKQPIHQAITEEKLQSADYSDKSGKVAGDANWYTDVFEVGRPEAHFDNETLSAGSARLRGKIDSIIQNLADCDKKKALKEMGRALHTVQDFYSHSNWVEHWGGLHRGIYDLPDPPRELYCSPPDFAPGGLTTGYFSLLGWVMGNQCLTTPSNKCCHQDLHKDDASRQPFFGPARAAAEEATTEFAGRVEREILSRYPGERGEAMVRLLKKDQRDVAFVLDDTGSMSEELADVKTAVSAYIDSIAADEEPPRFFLYTFKDSTRYRGSTCDAEQIKAMVAPLFPSGGGDCPEMSNSAQLEAAAAIEEGGEIFFATDASPRDPEVGPTLLALVQSKNIDLEVILTGNCVSDSSLAAVESDALSGAVGTNATTPPVIPPGDLTSSSSQRSFSALAALSGGLFFRVARSEFDQAASIILNRTRPDNADVLYAIDISGPSGKSYAVPVDSALEDVTFVVSRLQATGTFTLTLRRPDGSVVAAGDPGVSFTTVSGVRAVKVDEPVDGTWTLDVAGSGKFTASVFGKSKLSLTDFGFHAEPVGQRPEVELMPLPGLPIAGEAAIAEAHVTGERSSVSFGLRNADTTAIAPLELAEARPNVYRGTVTPPASDFLVYANGIDANGHPFQRVFREFFKASTVRVTPQSLFQTAAPGTTVTYVFDVTNLAGTAMSYRLYRNSASGYPVTGPTSLSLKAGETKPVTLTVGIPASAPDGKEDPLSLVVTSTTDPGVTNNAVVTTLVSGGNQPPDVAAARPSDAHLFPPNGQFEEVEIEGVTDPDGDAVTITIESIRQDEPVDASGDGSTCPDAGGVGTPNAMLRAERSGTGDGRVYEIAFTASDGRGGTAHGKVQVCVPHDMGQSRDCVDSVERHDSTSCPRE